MKLSNTAITEFKERYNKRFGVEISDQEANTKGLELLEYIQLIYREVPKEHQELLNSLII